MGDKEIMWNQPRYEEIDGTVIKIEEPKPKHSVSKNLDITYVNVPSISKSTDSNTFISEVEKGEVKRKCRGRPKKIQIVDKPIYPSPILLKKDRFRPIRPKPSQLNSSVLRDKFRLSVINMPIIPSNQTTVSDSIINEIKPFKRKYTRRLPIVSNKTNNCIKPNISNNANNSNVKNNITDNDTVNSNIISKTNNSDNNSNTENLPVIKKKKTVKTKNINTTANSNTSNTNNSNNHNNSSSYSNCNNSKDLRTKAISKSHKSSIELFFESMAQTVLNLPNEVQADIKMQICEIVTKAEIQHCGLQTKSKTKK
ncbi:putative mediator of RNA polymerase II transcription subunit 24 [Monomorium pharaonis]|uniref:putative mediator of RNA polymerase II transcription subunit 24 n=1 Tax=Monomorium pharaonis TaxID=307658 RepID=UPI001746D754|nr:putative mediator of RNA polymerase II transcription subunit 24 [Monomorium pharaonis]XP_012535475.2 putative mediator of RNA polymerase II transcription subunit 24 [Monomorium pharaonis]XP_012535476.2 putative mediator of RNA polymerase II transcription subunit 24 [Monomorium pharaonis]XP_012535477.2 putative mediator of RNA polymerase II transcription subunit 24 [Monomorium pharaonis]XP_012535478.2 putative mediator of RNA polymerase II transcription subunit 24 [Monomorium pharaonis]XP_01